MYIVCHYWYFDNEFKFQRSVYICWRKKLRTSLEINNIAIITVKSIDHCCVIYGVRKSAAIDLLKSSVLVDKNKLIWRTESVLDDKGWI